MKIASAYFTEAKSAKSLASKVQIKMHQSYPLQIVFIIDDDSRNGFFRYFIAPKLLDAELAQ